MLKGAVQQVKHEASSRFLDEIRLGETGESLVDQNIPGRSPMNRLRLSFNGVSRMQAVTPKKIIRVMSAIR